MVLISEETRKHTRTRSNQEYGHPEKAQKGPTTAGKGLSRGRALERQLGRLEGRLELSERAESTIREERDRLLRELEEERAERRRLQEQLETERSRGFWKRLFGR